MTVKELMKGRTQMDITNGFTINEGGKVFYSIEAGNHQVSRFRCFDEQYRSRSIKPLEIIKLVEI